MNSAPSSQPPGETTGAPKISARKKIIPAVCALFGLAIVALVIWLGGSGTVSFTMVLDGKPLPISAQPQVLIDGEPYSPELPLRPGIHSLVVNLPNAQPFTKRVWVFWGHREIGALPLSTLKGGLKIEVTPSPAAIVLRQATEKLLSGNAPVTLKEIPVGSYVVEVTRGDYSEYIPVEIAADKIVELNIALNVGSLDLSASHVDAEYELNGNGQVPRHGKLPDTLADVPVGRYSLLTRRKGWDLPSEVVAVLRGVNLVHKTEFPYGSIAVGSEPSNFSISKDGVVVGVSPITLGELRPGKYKLAAIDGANELTADVNIEPNEAAKHVFVFRYGAVQLTSTPPGATVVRKGKELGKTPLTLNRLVTGDTTFELRLDGYESATSLVHVEEGATANRSVKLFSERYVQAVKQAAEALHAGRLAESQRLIANALELEPNDPPAIRLQDEVSRAAHKAEEARREAEEQVSRANEKVRRREFAEQAIEKRRNFLNELAKLSENQDFEIHTREFPYSFETVWGTAGTILRQKDSGSVGDTSSRILRQQSLYKQPSKGILDFLGDGDYRNHWMLITPVDRVITRVELKLFNFEMVTSPNAYAQMKVQNGQPYKFIRNGFFTFGLVLDKDLVRRRAAEFFDEIEKSLPPVVARKNAPLTITPTHGNQNEANAGKPGFDLVDQLVALKNKTAQPQISGDRLGIESMLDPAYTLVQDGRLFSRSAYLSTIKPMPAIISYAVESPEARLENDRAVLTGYMHLQVLQQGELRSMRYKFRDVFVQRDGRWLFLSSEIVTDVPR